MTSSAKKKSVFNSTSESDNVVPTDWDASAIAAPPQDKNNVINPGTLITWMIFEDRTFDFTEIQIQWL